LLLALERGGGIEPKHAFYVGDALDDMRMARAAGVPAVGIESMLANADELRAAGGSETAASVTEWVDRLLATTPENERSAPEPTATEPGPTEPGG
jgi:phosphoglycolate phosphatase